MIPALQLDATIAGILSSSAAEILSGVADCVIIADLHGNVVWMNPVALRLFGFSGLSECQRPLRDYAAILSIFSEDGVEIPLSDWPLTRVLRGETLLPGNVEVHFHDARPSLLVCISGNLARSGDGEAQAAFLTARDLTQSRLFERDREIAEEEQRVALEAADVGLWRRDLKTEVARLSARAEQHFGFAPGRSVSFHDIVLVIHKADRDRVLATLESAVRERSDFESEYRVVHPNGTERWIASRGRPTFDAGGAPDRIYGSTVDITERRRAAEELLAVQHRFQYSQKLESLGVLAGGVAHDFNNLLTGILGNASLVHDSLSPGDPDRVMLNEVIHAGERAADLTRQLLAYAGKGRFVTRRIPLSALVRDSERLTRASIPKTIHVACHLPDALPVIEGDPSQIQQIVVNLILNAAEAIGPDRPGTVLIETSECDLHPQDAAHFLNGESIPGGRYVVLSVHDTGAGMDEATQSRIFDPFFTTKFTGRGLGLSAALGIVRGHKGALRVESEPGQGASFTVLFPIAPNQPEIVQSPAAGGSEMVLAIGPCNAQLNSLRELGYPVLFCENLRLAESVLREGREPVAIVICSGGQEDLPALVHTHRPGVHVILSSPHRRPEQIRKHPGHRYSAYLNEHTPSEELDRVIRRLLSGG